MAELVLIRHAQPDWEPDGRAVDHPALTGYGQRQAEAVAGAIAGPFDAFYVSPLQRAQETAEPIARSLGHEPKTLSWLAEIRLPPLEGLTPDEVQDHFRETRARDLGDWWDPMPGGESFRHMYERVSSGVESLLSSSHGMRIHQNSGYRIWHPEHEDARILIVAHNGTNSVIVSHLLGIEPVPWAWSRFASPWTGVTRLRTAPAANGFIWELAGFGRVDHLVGLDAERDPEAG